MRAALCAAVLFTCAALPVHAASQRLLLEGVLDQVTDDANLLAGVGVMLSVGDPFRFDGEGPGVGVWSGAFRVGDTLFKESFDVSVQNDTGVGDSISLTAVSPGVSARPQLETSTFFVRFANFDGTALDSSDYPASIALGDWDVVSFGVRGVRNDIATASGSAPLGPEFILEGRVTGVSTVPEPHSALLCLLGLVGVAGVRRRYA